jgi:hypothetical protein
VARSTVELELIAVVSKAAKTVEDFASSAQKSLSGISIATTISGINDGFELVQKTAGAAISKVVQIMGDAIDEASKAEQAITQLSNALRLTNDFSQESVKDFEEFAKQVQLVTTFTDEAVLSSLALAKQFKATNSEAKKVVSAAADLAAATGTDLESATRQISLTLNGFVDRGLGRAIPQLKNMTKESLVAGDAIDIIGKRFKGSADILGDTFSGAVTKTKNQFSDLQETLGNLIVQNPTIIEGIKLIGKAFAELNAEFKANGTSFQEIVTNGFLLIISIAPKFVKAMENIFNNLSFGGLLVDQLGASLGALGAILANPFEAKDILKQFKQDLEDLDVAFGKKINASEDFFGAIEKQSNDVIASITKVSQEAKKGTKEVEGLSKSLSGKSSRFSDIFSGEELRQEIEKATKEPIKAFLDLSVRGRLDAKAGIAIGTGLATNVVKGAKGAQELLSKAIGTAADALIPGIGGAVSEIVDVLAQGPEKTRQMVDEFTSAIPQLIENLAQSLPVLIEELVRTLPPALAKAMPIVAVGFSTELIKNIPNIVKGLAQGLIDAAKGFVEAIFNFVKTGGGLFGGGGSGGGGIPVVGDIVSGIGSIFGFADGGRIPDRPKFNNDGGLARVSSGEQILSQDLTNRLERFLDGGSQSSQPLTVKIVVGQQELARAILDLNRNGFRTA